jgi:AmmeMemoRadiSam system protein A
MTSSLVQLAKDTIDAYIREGKRIRPPEELAPEMNKRAGVFVSIHKGEDLRGCIGTIEPARENVAEEIIANAISASTRDPRFDPITPDELKDLDINVDVLTEPEAVKDASTLDPKKYGVIVECGYRRGLLLPDLPGVESVQEQINICCAKGGIRPGEPVKLYKFEVKRYK